MGKHKNSKRGNLKKPKKGKRTKQTVSFKAKGVRTTPVENPFELRVNKRKHDNLGRRGRNEQGVPGISRGRAVEKRKATLLQEYKVRNKTNVLVDRRIGEMKGMPEEEKIIRRSAAEKARQFKKKSIFNLQDADDMFLTHKGKPLMDVDRYEDPRDASDSDEERLGADFVTDAHFGGFMTIKKPTEVLDEDDLDEDGKPKSHKQIIQELIAESKRKKYEKAKEADENYELVCKLDDEFKNPDIRGLLLMSGKNKVNEESVPAPKPDDNEEYDKLVKALQFETKTGRATDRLKTEDELAQEEKDKLEQLERERLKRMKMADNDEARNHRSADDLDDGFTVENDFNLVDAAGDIDDDECNDEQEEEEEEEDSDASDSFSDVGSDKEEDQETQHKAVRSSKTEPAPALADNEEPFLDIPYVIPIPIKYKDFESLLKKHRAHYKYFSDCSLEALNIILSRVIKYNKASDRSQLPRLFNFVIRHVMDMAEKDRKLTDPLLRTLRIVMPHLHSILLLCPNECIQEVESGEIFDDFYPLQDLPVHKLLYLSMCSQLFSVTDFHHKVWSSMKVSLLEVLSHTKALNVRVLAKLLFVVKILHKISEESKRYTPEVVSLLLSILHCFAGTDTRWIGFAIPTIRLAKPYLYVSPEDCSESSQVNDELWRMTCDDTESITPGLPEKLGVLSVTLLYLRKFIRAYEKLPSAIEIFCHAKKPLTELQKRTTWPKCISDSLSNTMDLISKLRQKREVLVVPVSDRPRPLKLYEPLLEEGFDGIRKRKAPKGKQETARLVHKVKQEMKHAVREIRKDTAFLAKQQLKEQLEKDAERKRKVKEILGDLATQEGEYKKSKKLKK